MRKLYSTALLLSAMSFIAFSIPPVDDYCIDNDPGQEATGYCNYDTSNPGENALYCYESIGYPGQEMSCIGSLLFAKHF